MATAMADGRGNLGAGCQHRGAFPGQEQGHVQFALQRAGPSERITAVLAATFATADGRLAPGRCPCFDAVESPVAA